MYTQCPNCNTVFALTEENLRTHQGVVRCGRCREVFNASWNLVDTLPTEESVPPRTSVLNRNEEPESQDPGPSEVSSSKGQHRAVYDADQDSDQDPRQPYAPTGFDGGMYTQPEVEVDATDPLQSHASPEPREGVVEGARMEIEAAGVREFQASKEGEGAGVEPSGSESEVFADTLKSHAPAEPEAAGVAQSGMEFDDKLKSHTPPEPEEDTAAQAGVGPEATEDTLEAHASNSPEESVAAQTTVEVEASGNASLMDDSSDQSLLSGLTTEELNFLEDRMGSGENLLSGSEQAASPDNGGPTPQQAGSIPDHPDVVDSAGQVEEIVIEAPPSSWNVEKEELVATDRTDTDANLAAVFDQLDIGPEESPATLDVRSASGDNVAPKPHAERASERRSISVPQLANDVKLVEIPYPQPIKTAAWALAALFLLLGIIWQAREFYLNDLAAVPALREPLNQFCDYLSCSVPPRSDIKAIDLVNTSVDPHPITPGALRVSAYLVNRASFVQPFPPLEVTLTDKEGKVVGRRTFQPHEYNVDLSKRMSPNVIERTDFDLAQPAESALGYEIQLVAK